MTRIALFALATLVVAAGAFLASRDRREPAGGPRDAHAVHSGRPVQLPAPRDPLTPKPSPPSSRRIAERFLRAFERYERGRADERELRATTTDEFGDQLLARPPRPPHAGQVPAASVVSLTAVRRGGTIAGWDAHLRDGTRVSLITLTVLRERGRWRVAALR